jgi:hypothetical protein
MTTHQASERSLTPVRAFRGVITVAVIPAAWLLLNSTGSTDTVFFGWAVAAAGYVILLSGLAITNRSIKETQPKFTATIARGLGVLVWGGVLAVLYLLLYYIVFDRNNLFPQ